MIQKKIIFLSIFCSLFLTVSLQGYQYYKGDQRLMKTDYLKAIMNNDFYALMAIIYNGFDSNTRLHGDRYVMPLHIATYPEAVQLLIDRKADVNGKDFIGRTPIFYVQSLKVAQMLIENGADLNHEAKLGTPLYYFICNRHFPKDSIKTRLDTIKFFIVNGAEIGSKCEESLISSDDETKTFLKLLEKWKLSEQAKRKKNERSALSSLVKETRQNTLLAGTINAFLDERED
jgi:hypothetical protein